MYITYFRHVSSVIKLTGVTEHEIDFDKVNAIIVRINFKHATQRCCIGSEALLMGTQSVKRIATQGKDT